MRNGSDTLAIACILGGGLIAGGVTLALASGPEAPSLACATTVGPDTDVVMRLGGEGLVVVTPDTRVRAMGECMAAEAEAKARYQAALAQSVERGARDDAEREIDRVRREADRMRAEADRVRREVDRVRERVRRHPAGADERRTAALRLLEEVGDRTRDVERARVEQVREQVQRSRAEVERRRERADWQRERIDRQRERIERVRRVRERMARVERDRLVERIERAAERQAAQGERAARVAAERAAVAAERAAAAAERVGTPDFGEVGVTGSLAEGLRIRLPDRTFDVRFEGLDDLVPDVDWEDLDPAELDRQEQIELEEGLRTQLQVLEALDLDLGDIDEELAREIELRIEQEMAEVELRLAGFLEAVEGR